MASFFIGLFFAILKFVVVNGVGLGLSLAAGL